MLATDQRSHGTVQCMSVVPAEFWIRAFEGWITMCFWLFDSRNRDEQMRNGQFQFSLGWSL